MKKKSIQLIIFLLSLSSYITYAQSPTIGLRYHDQETFDGYLLFTPESNNDVYLINNCGEVINEWNFTEIPGATCYLLDNGNLLRAGKNNIEIRDWNDSVIWSYAMSNLGLNQHHDIAPTPNGNILCLVKDNYTNTEMISMGKDPETVADVVRLDKIIELEPNGANDANVVWEWKFVDHVIQEFDSTKPNYGIVADHPELFDLNYIDDRYNLSKDDYTHANAIDYNPDLDQVLVSFRSTNEIFIIDHSTTTLEAASHSGGNSNKGGDILWRWGNPQMYHQGNSSDKKLIGPHDPQWVKNGYLNAGKITVFNNEGDGTNTFSSIHIIEPEFENSSYIMESGIYKPLDYTWSWNGSVLGETVYESKKSGCHALPNGNMIIAENSKGQVSEIALDGTILWTYKNPTGANDMVFSQFETDTPANGFFRAEKYPTYHPGFSGKDLTPNGIIENNNPISDLCQSLMYTDFFEENNLFVINPVINGNLIFSNNITLDSITITDFTGKIVFNTSHFSGENVNIPLPNSLYLMIIKKDGKKSTHKLLFTH